MKQEYPFYADPSAPFATPMPPVQQGYAVQQQYQQYPAPSNMLHPGREQRLKDATRGLNRMGMITLVQTVMSFLFSSLFLGLYSLIGMDITVDNIGYLWLSGMMAILSTALPFVIYLFAIRATPTYYLKFEKVGVFGAILCVLAGTAVCLLANYPAFVVQSFFGSFGYQASSAITTATTLPEILLELFTTALLVPVLEEFVFRGVIFSSLKKHGTAFAVVSSAIIFSLVHLDFSNVVFALVAGLVFGYVYAKTQNLWITIAIHAINNAIAVFSSNAGFFFGKSGPIVGELVFWGIAALGLLALSVLLIFKRKLLFTVRHEQNYLYGKPLEGKNCVSCIVRAPTIWIIFGLMVAFTVSLFF